MSIGLMMPFSHLILYHPLLLLPLIFPNIRIFPTELALCIRWPKYWSFSISPSNEYLGLISFRIDWFDLAVHRILNSSPVSQLESINSLVLSLLYGPTLTSVHDYWKNHSFNYTDLCWQIDVSVFILNKFSRLLIDSLPGASVFYFHVAITVCSDFGAQEK